jgi:hypothetical protein
MFFIHRMTARVQERIVHVRARLASLRTTLTGAAANGARRFGPWLRHALSRAKEEVRARWPAFRERLATEFRPAVLRRRADIVRTWMKEHDTVPQAATAKRRVRLMERLQRQDQRAAERELRLEELAKKREKKELEERQTYSVYFE